MRVPWWAWALAGIVLVAGLLSPFASRLPDGLESAIEREQIEVKKRGRPSPFPEYETPGVGHTRLSVFLAAAAGIVVVFLVTLLLGKLLSRRKNRAETPKARTDPEP